MGSIIIVNKQASRIYFCLRISHSAVDVAGGCSFGLGSQRPVMSLHVLDNLMSLVSCDNVLKDKPNVASLSWF